MGKIEISSRTATLADFHFFDEPVLDGVDVMDDLVDEEIAVAVADHLVYLDVCPACLVNVDADGFDVWIQHVPLAKPVFAHIFAPLNSPAFHAVGPVDQRMEVGENGVYLTGVEGFIGRLKQIFLRFHGVGRLLAG